MYCAMDNEGKKYSLYVESSTSTIARECIGEGVRYVDILSDDFHAHSGSEGYYVVGDVNSRGSYLCRFNKRRDMERIYKQNLLPIFGMKTPKHCLTGIVESMKQNFYLVTGVKNDTYYIKLRFELTGHGVMENIQIRIVDLGPEKGYKHLKGELG